MQLWALIVDGFRESRDRKIFWVLIGLSILIALVMASIGFEEDRVTFFFGLFDAQSQEYNPLSSIGRVKIASIVVYLLLDLMLGWIGVLLMIIATAGEFPVFLERGAIDVLLGKPISRPRLFFYKYLAGLVFVLIQAVFFVCLTFLVMGLRWGVWLPGYLLAAPLLVLVFSYLYCVSVLVGIKTRSPVAASLLTIGLWVVFGLVVIAPQTLEVYAPSIKQNTRIYNAVRVLAWIPPKTADFPTIAAKWSGAGTSADAFPNAIGNVGSEEERAQLRRARNIEEQELAKNPVYSIGSSLLFEVAVLLLAMRAFVRRDY